MKIPIRTNFHHLHLRLPSASSIHHHLNTIQSKIRFSWWQFLLCKILAVFKQTQQIEYVDDIEPLLQEDNNNMKYIPIPVQEPMLYQNRNQ